ncbi:hypothetical protein HanPSC8_Chr10g0406351 [Helianthus annuus]|nr:hypothetical protein HanLR1_Chr10g0345701 [Helianthus annuus]KAJ0882150.1 hypothetical protein HanPSC8_Chr10g0406351 [Helianthus annuus]
MAADALTTCKHTLFSFIVSHPLYFSYLIFFSPFLFKFFLFIFFSPLFLTTSLLLILATTLPHSNIRFLTSIFNNINIRFKVNDVDQQNEEFREFEDLEIYKTVFDSPPLLTVGEDDDEVTVTDEQRSLRLERLFEELDRFEGCTETAEMNQIEENIREFQKLGPVSDEDEKTDENSLSLNSNSWRSESSSSFGSCGSIGDETTTTTTTFETKKKNETKSYVEKVIGELQKSNSTVAIEAKKKTNSETTSHVRKMLLKLEPVTSSITGEEQQITVKSNSTANETTSHVRKALQKNSTTAIPVSGEDQMKNNETTSSHVKKMLQKLEPELEPVPVTVSGEEDERYEIENTFSLRTNSWRLDSSGSFGSYGSMRKEKEWKRTLACKLFEERNNNSERGEEGMDCLWEAYEDDNSSKKPKNRKEAMRNEKKGMMKKKSEFKCFEDEDEDEDEDEEFMRNGQLCCLKALKLSTGKMNLGMGKPNLVKISKAIKGFGWLHHVGSKHGKKKN